MKKTIIAAILVAGCTQTPAKEIQNNIHKTATESIQTINATTTHEQCIQAATTQINAVVSQSDALYNVCEAEQGKLQAKIKELYALLILVILGAVSIIIKR